MSITTIMVTEASNNNQQTRHTFLPEVVGLSCSLASAGAGKDNL